MDEFFGWLIVGLCIIAVALFFFGQPLQFPTDRGNATTTTTTIPAIPEQHVFFVGPQDITIWRSVEVGELNVSYASNEVKESVAEKHLFNGLMFGSNKLEISSNVDTKNLVGCYISFDVEKTNNYGTLCIKLNGNVINVSRFSTGRHKMLVNNSLVKRSNKIEFIPASSSWKIWAPTVYDLKDVEFVCQGLHSKSSKFSFTIYENEFNNLAGNEGRLVLDLTEHKGELRINLNGHEIFHGPTKAYDTIHFDQRYLKMGDNTIEFVSEVDSLFQGDARLIFYYNTTRENVAEKAFSLSNDEYDDLENEPASVTFNITNILTDGGFSLTIQDAEGVVHQLVYDAIREGNLTYSFNNTHCTPGYNIIRIKSVDDGAFYLKDFEVKIKNV